MRRSLRATLLPQRGLRGARIVVVDESRARAAVIEEGLRRTDLSDVALFVDRARVAARLKVLCKPMRLRRVSAGVEARTKDWFSLPKSEANLAIATGYNRETNGKTTYMLVSDLQNVEPNRLKVQFCGLTKRIVTFGRQIVNLDDQRVVGALPLAIYGTAASGPAAIVSVEPVRARASAVRLDALAVR